MSTFDLEQALSQIRQSTELEKARAQEATQEKEALEQRVLELEKIVAKMKARHGEGEPAGDLLRAEERIALLERQLGEALEVIDAERFERDLLEREKAGLLRRIEELEGGRAADAAVAIEAGSPADKAPACPDVSSPHRTNTGHRHPAPVVRRPPPKGAFFRAEWDLEYIEYDSPDDVLEIYESMNLSQLSLEGFHSQYCASWIVGMQKAEERRVYIAFHLSEIGRNLIYSPVRAMRRVDDYARTLREAIAFLEVVGYLPEKMGGGERPGPEVLERVVVLRPSARRAGSF